MPNNNNNNYIEKLTNNSHIIYSIASFSALASSILTWNNNIQDKENIHCKFAEMLLTSVAPISWSIFIAMELHGHDHHGHNHGHNNNNNNNNNNCECDPQTDLENQINNQINKNKITKLNYFNNNILKIAHMGFMISSPYVFYLFEKNLVSAINNISTDINNSPVNPIINHVISSFLVLNLFALSMLTYNKFGFKDFKTLQKNKNKSTKMAQEVLLLLFLGGFGPGLMLNGELNNTNNILTSYFLAWPEIHVHREHLRLIKCNKLKAKDINILNILLKLAALLYGFMHASDDIYASFQQFNKPEPNIKDYIIIAILLCGSIFETMIGSLESNEQINDYINNKNKNKKLDNIIDDLALEYEQNLDQNSDQDLNKSGNLDMFFQDETSLTTPIIKPKTRKQKTKRAKAKTETKKQNSITLSLLETQPEKNLSAQNTVHQKNGHCVNPILDSSNHLKSNNPALGPGNADDDNGEYCEI